MPVHSESKLSSLRSGSGSTVSFKYDPFGRRIYKSSSTATSVYAYDGDNLIEETNSSGAVVARYPQTQNIDEPLAMLRSSATSYYHADGLGSVTSLSTSAGAIANTYTYDSFGNLTASTGSLVNPFRYTARESDTETALYYYRARYYDPSTGHFLSEDPMGFQGGRNFYRYVNNSPTSGNDPSGLWSPAAHDQLIWNALHPCGVSNADIWQIQQGSRWFDRNFQDPRWSFGHAMSNGNANQSAEDAMNQMAAFIAGQMRVASNAWGAGAQGQALFDFGIGIHPIMDQTSPAHTDAQGNPIPWCGLSGCGGLNGLEQVNEHSAYDITGIERIQDLTAAVQGLNNARIRALFQKLTGRQLDCGCRN